MRYHQVILRSEFDKHRCVKDPKEQRRLLWMGENEVFMKATPLTPCKCKENLLRNTVVVIIPMLLEQ